MQKKWLHSSEEEGSSYSCCRSDRFSFSASQLSKQVAPSTGEYPSRSRSRKPWRELQRSPWRRLWWTSSSPVLWQWRTRQGLDLDRKLHHTTGYDITRNFSTVTSHLKIVCVRICMQCVFVSVCVQVCVCEMVGEPTKVGKPKWANVQSGSYVQR